MTFYKSVKYFLRGEWQSEDDWCEVTKEEFIKAERAAGFFNTMGNRDEPATGGFSGVYIQGRVRYRD